MFPGLARIHYRPWNRCVEFLYCRRHIPRPPNHVRQAYPSKLLPLGAFDELRRAEGGPLPEPQVVLTL